MRAENGFHAIYPIRLSEIFISSPHIYPRVIFSHRLFTFIALYFFVQPEQIFDRQIEARTPMLDIPAARTAPQLNARQLFMLFPTPMFTGMLPDISLCDRVEKKIWQLQKSGKGRSSPAGANRAYMTPDDLHTVPEMKELVDVILSESGKVLDAFAIIRDSHYITSMWANITHPNNRQNMHVHPNCLLSGLVYIRTPTNCGPTMFASPRRLSKNLEPRYLEKNELNADFFIVPAEKGRMLIWPSYVPHAVEQGTANEADERIVVPFNIMIRGLIELFTARLDLS